MAAAALAALLTVLLVGCEGQEHDLGALQWQNSQLQGQVAQLEARLDERRADGRAAAWAYACDYVVPTCPPVTVARGRAVIARDGKPAMGGWLATLLALKALLAAALYGVSRGAFRATMKWLYASVLEARAAAAKRTLAAAVPAAVEQRRSAAVADADAAERRLGQVQSALDEKQSVLGDIEDTLQGRGRELEAINAEIGRREAILRVTGDQLD